MTAGADGHIVPHMVTWVSPGLASLAELPPRYHCTKATKGQETIEAPSWASHTSRRISIRSHAH